MLHKKVEGLVKYNWEKPGKSTLQPKFSYGTLFQKWNWIVATGAYVDEIEDNVAIMNKETKAEIQAFIIKIIVTSVVVLIVLIVLASIMTNKAIAKPLEDFQNGLMGFFKYLK